MNNALDFFSTDELAAMGKVRPATLIASLSAKGHWLGLRPVRLPNRRLMWPADEARQVLHGVAK